MYNANPKIKFYNLGSEKIDFSKIINKESLDSSKPVVVSKGFNEALKSVIDKDIDFLSDKVNKIVKEITKLLVINGFNSDVIDGDIRNVDDIVNDVETIISKVIIEKESIKVGLFSSHKKEKKKKYKNLEDGVSTLLKYQSELISIKNEYNKLNQRKTVLKDVVFDEEDDKVSNEDPLERTVNFYMKQTKGN